ncbi:phytoene dehydrogenase-like protein [Paraburkholderia sp. RAU6.4a]
MEEESDISDAIAKFNLSYLQLAQQMGVVALITGSPSAVSYETIMSKLSGNVAIVTGASRGIGAAIAKSLAAEGASVVVNFAFSKRNTDDRRPQGNGTPDLWSGCGQRSVHRQLVWRFGQVQSVHRRERNHCATSLATNCQSRSALRSFFW